MSKSSNDDIAEGFSWGRIKLLFTTSPRELWIIYVLKILESYNYFTLSLLYPFYLTDEFGVNDEDTGASLGLLGTIATIYGILLSPIIDYVGAKPCLLFSFLMSAATRLGLAFAPNAATFYGLVYGPMSIAFSLGMPVLMIAIKKYTPSSNLGMAYAFYYSMMNVSALLAGFSLDFFTITLRNGLGTNILAFSNGYRTLMALASVTSTIAALVVFCLREPREVMLEQKDLLGYSDIEDTTGDECTKLMSFRDRAHQFGLYWLDIMRDIEFWKFMAVCVITVNMRSLFRHLDFTMPKFVKRAFGCNAPAGMLYSINPMIVIITVPIIGVLTNDISHFDVIHYGSYLHATSAFWLAGFQTMWATAMFVFQLSIGEAIWSPRWYDYSMSVAPNGREGLFVALAAAPLFFSKLPTGYLSGWLLMHFCPGNENTCPNNSRIRRKRTPPPAAPGVMAPPLPPHLPCRGKQMWLWIGVIAITSPLMLLVFYRWLKPVPKEPASKKRPDVEAVRKEDAWAKIGDRDVVGTHVPGLKSSRSGRIEDDSAPLLSRFQPKSD